MSDFASNTPISGPAYLSDWKADWDIGGMVWSNEHGMFYRGSAAQNDLVPFRLPTQISGGR